MKSYTENEVRELVEENLKHLMEITKLKEQLSKEVRRREFAEKKYSHLCEKCTSFYVTSKDIDVDTMFVQVSAPRFMSNDDFAKGIIQHIVSACVAEREKTIYHDVNTSRYKPRM